MLEVEEAREQSSRGHSALERGRAAPWKVEGPGLGCRTQLGNLALGGSQGLADWLASGLEEGRQRGKWWDVVARYMRSVGVCSEKDGDPEESSEHRSDMM